jgi:hypothetical protein
MPRTVQTAKILRSDVATGLGHCLTDRLVNLYGSEAEAPSQQASDQLFNAADMVVKGVFPVSTRSAALVVTSYMKAVKLIDAITVADLKQEDVVAKTGETISETGRKVAEFVAMASCLQADCQESSKTVLKLKYFQQLMDKCDALRKARTAFQADAAKADVQKLCQEES